MDPDPVPGTMNASQGEGGDPWMACSVRRSPG